MLSYPDIPNHQSWVPNYAKAKTAWQAFQNKYRTTDGVDIDAELDDVEDDPPGHLRRGGPVARLLLTAPSGFPRPEGATIHLRDGAAQRHDRHDRGARSSRTAPTGQPRWSRRRRGREALWGFVFIGPWLIGLVLFTAGPMIASLVLSLTNFDLVHPESVQFIGLDNYVRMASRPERRRSRSGRHVPVRRSSRSR